MSEITKDLRQVPRGQWKVARIDGTIEVNVGKPTIAAVQQAIGATCLDTVNLREAGRPTGVVMFVDDNGVAKRRVPNEAATEIYLAQCHPGTTHQIRGDVALVNDADFG